MPQWAYEISSLKLALVMVATIEAVSLIGLLLARRFVLPHLRFHDGVNDAISGTVQAIGVFYGITVALIAVGVWNTNSNASDLASKEAATFAFSLAVLVRVNTSVPFLTSYVAAYGCLASLGVFLFLIDHVGKFLRPSGALRSVGTQGRKIIENVYPRRLSQAQETPAAPVKALDSEPTRTIPNMKDGVVLAFDMRGLVSLAQHADCVVELVPQVGDFVAADDPLFRVFQGGETLSEDSLRQCIAFGFERTLEQDPTFAFRIIVDIASKGLSPAINDPTTAVLSIDQIHHLLRTVGNRQLADGREPDATGTVRLVYRTPDWEDFVHLALTEIRHYGQGSIQVIRRLRAMLENLIDTLPERRAPLLQEELSLLHRSTERFFSDPEDRALAGASDLQGMGGGTSEENEKRVRVQITASR